MKKIFALTAVLASLASSAETFNVSPGNGSFEQAAKKWKPGDTIVMAPGEYHNVLHSGRLGGKPSTGGLTLRAAIPGSVVFRGDREAPKFTDCGGGIWKAECKKIPETVFERDTFTVYKYRGTLPEVRYDSGSWTWDEKSGTLYIRTTDSAAPDRHCLTIGVTPDSCISFYTNPSLPKGICDVLLEGFLVTGYYSRIKFEDQRLPSSQKKVPWGVVFNHTQKNVRVNNVTAFLNGLGIGFCVNNAGGIIENCGAFGNWNPYCYSGDGIGIYGGSKDCIIRDCVGADNRAIDIFLYSGPIGPKTVMSRNIAYGMLRVKAQKKKGFAVTDCIANTFSHLAHPWHMRNSTAFGTVPAGDEFVSDNLLFAHEKGLSADKIYADPDNFDCRLQSGVPESVAKRAPKSKWANKVYFVKSSGNDSAGGRSVADAFGSLKKAQEALQGSGADLYIIGPVQGDLILKGLKDAAVRGRGKFPAEIKGKIVLENCENVTLERLMPRSISIRGGKQIAVSQSTAALTAENTEGLRLTHSHFPTAKLNGCRNSFVTANVFGQKQISGTTGWSDYNAYAANVPAGEKHSFQAKPEMGKKGTFRNAWLFDGRAISGMPAGPYRRQHRNVEFKVAEPRFSALTPNSAVITLTSNIPFNGELRWGTDEKCSNRVVLGNSACTHHIGLTELKPDQKYYYYYRLVASRRSCFSNAELKEITGKQLVNRCKVRTFSPAKEFAQPKEYFVSNSGDDSASGSADQPFASISRGVEALRPGDTLTIRGGNYAETINIPVSGTKDHPITIRGAKGEFVRLCGGKGQLLEDGIRIINQSNLIFENLNVIGDRMNSDDGYIINPILAVNAGNITFRNLMVGGGTHKIHAARSRDLLVEDCIFSFGHEGLTAENTSITIRNCIFAFGGVNQITLRNWNGEKCVLENCILFDMLNMKGANPIVHVNDIAAFTERNNCFYTRFANETKPIYGWNVSGKEMAPKTSKSINKFPYLGRCEATYPDYLKRTGRERTSFFANPDIKIYPDFKIKYPDLPAFLKVGKKNENFSWEEHRYAGKVGREKRANFLPANPEVIKRGCGPRMK